jgi:hypothetical protein
VEAFLEQQEAGLRLAMQMMGDMLGDEEAADIAEEL